MSCVHYGEAGNYEVGRFLVDTPPPPWTRDDVCTGSTLSGAVGHDGWMGEDTRNLS